MSDEYRMPEKTCQQHVEDMVSLSKVHGFSSPEYAAGVLAEFIVQRGLHRHAMAIGTMVKANRMLSQIFDIMQTGSTTNESLGAWVFDHMEVIREVLGR